jgi:hypothetical protein
MLESNESGRRNRATIGSVERLLSLRQLQSNKAIRAHPRSRKPLTLLLALVLCLFVFVLSSNEAWAKGLPSSTEQQQPTVERTTIVKGKQVADPEPVPQPTLLQRMVATTTTGDETAGPRAEPASASQKIDLAPTTTTTTTPSTTSFELAPVSVSATPTVDRGSPEIESSTAAEESSAALPAGLSAPSEVWEPVKPSPALQQQVAQVAASQEQSRPSYYSTSKIAPSSAAVQPLTWTLNNVIGTNTSATASAVAGVLGTVGNWLSEAPSNAEDSSSSSEGTWPAPSGPVSPEQQQPLGSSYIGLSSGMGQASSAGGLGTTLLLGVLFVASIELLRRDFRTYLVSIELPKPSSALLSPLERPG